MNIAEFRRQHPDYDDMSDAEVSAALHQKFYSDVPKDEFESLFLGGGGGAPQQNPQQMDVIPSHAPSIMPQDQLMPSHQQPKEQMSEGEQRLFAGLDVPPVQNPSPMETMRDDGPRGIINTPRAAENFPKSAKEFAVNTSKLVTEFPAVVDGIKAIASGAYKTMTTGEVDPVISQIGEAINKRYGSVDKFLETYETDPMAATVDVMGAMGLAGGALKVAGKALDVQPLIQAGKVATEIATAGDIPTQAFRAAAKVTQPMARNLMEGVTKFGTTVDRTTRNKLLDTMFKYNILPNESGLNKTWDLIKNRSDEVDDIINSATTANEVIPKYKLFRHMRESIDSASKSGLPQQNRSKVLRVYKQWMDELSGQNTVTPKQAQDFKKGIYSEINYDRKVGSAKPMYTEVALKDLARGFKESLEEVPGLENLKYINASEGDLLNLTEHLARTVNRLGNRKGAPFGVGHAIGGGFGVGVGSLLGDTGSQAGFILGVIAADPRTQARFAMILNKANKLAQKAETAGQAGSTMQQASRSTNFANETP